MPKPIDLPPEIAKAFVRDMKAFFAKESKMTHSCSTAAIG